MSRRCSATHIFTTCKYFYRSATDLSALYYPTCVCVPEVAVHLIWYKNTFQYAKSWLAVVCPGYGVDGCNWMFQLWTLLHERTHMRSRAHTHTQPSSQQLQLQRANRCLSKCPLRCPAARTTRGPGGLGASLPREPPLPTTPPRALPSPPSNKGRSIIQARFAMTKAHQRGEKKKRATHPKSTSRFHQNLESWGSDDKGGGKNKLCPSLWECVKL